MNPGEYIGKDGRIYRWISPNNNRKYRPVSTTSLGYECEMVYLSADDWPAAKAALDELIKAESGDWVEWISGESGTHCRIHADGTNPQWWYSGESRWVDEAEDSNWPKAYNKGHEIAQAETADLREAAKKLVEAVNKARLWHSNYSLSPELPNPTKLNYTINCAMWETIKAAAKNLEEKL